MWSRARQRRSPAWPRVLDASELAARGRWEVLVGDVDRGIPPGDPFLRESWAARLDAGKPLAHPLLSGVATTPPGVSNPINGNEYEIPGRDDLQCACVFDLAEPRDCRTHQGACACQESSASTATRPLCAGGEPVQGRAGAYPGLRHLELLRELGDGAVVASICPKLVTGDRAARAFGLGPAFDAIAERAREVLEPGCLPRALPVDPAKDRPACRVVEARWRDDSGPCACEALGRASVDGALASATELVARRETGSCAALCLCEIVPSPQAAYDACRTELEPVLEAPAWCCVDEGQLVGACAPERRRRLRFLGAPGAPLPDPGARLYVACQGAEVEPAQP